MRFASRARKIHHITLVAVAFIVRILLSYCSSLINITYLFTYLYHISLTTVTVRVGFSFWYIFRSDIAPCIARPYVCVCVCVCVRVCVYYVTTLQGYILNEQALKDAIQ